MLPAQNGTSETENADLGNSATEQLVETPGPVETPEPAESTARPGLLGQLVRFGVVGVGCTLLDYGTYIVLGILLGWPYWLAKTIAFFLGTVASYLGNRRFTFRAGRRAPKAEVGGFVLLYGATFVANLGCNQVLLHVTGTGAGEFWAATLIWVAAQGLGTLINFALLRTMVFPPER